MSIDTQSPKSEAPAHQEDTRTPAPLGWLQALRARFGLQGPQTLRETLEVALRAEDPSAGAFSAEERDMLVRLLRFGGLRVDDVMVPRADIIAIEESEPISELLAQFEEAGVSRIPVYHDTLDDPRGMIHIKDLVSWMLAEASGRAGSAGKAEVSGKAEAGARSEAGARPTPSVKAIAPTDDALPRSNAQAGASANANLQAGASVSANPQAGASANANPQAGAFPPGFDLSRCHLDRPIGSLRIRRPVLYVPPSMPAQNLLVRMQTTRVHMAIVVDEYGGTDGLVTIEDLVEQVVGAIEDEHDADEDALIYRDPKLGLVAAARAMVADLETEIGVKLLTPDEAEDIDTLGGLVFSLVGRVPVRGEIVKHPSGLEFEVLDADARRVKKLKVHEPKTGAAGSSGLGAAYDPGR